MRAYPRPNIIDVFAERDSIDLSPVYQRISGVWDLRKRRLLIDSIVNGFDLPKIYFHELTPPRRADGRTLRYAIVDGKQRLEAIWSYMQDEFGLPADFRFFDDPNVSAGGARYSELASTYPKLRARFDTTNLPIVTILTDDQELIDDLFSRLNEAVPLTAPEYRNTLGGPLPRVFRELVNDTFFQACLPFETGRHRYLDLAAKFSFICSEDDFVSTKKAELDQFVIRFRRGREEGVAWADRAHVESLESSVRSILDQMAEFFDASDPLLSSIGWITLYFHMFRIGRGQRLDGLERHMFSAFVNDVSRTRLILRNLAFTFEGREEADPQLAQFDSLRQSLNDAFALRTRYQILCSYLSRKFGVELPTL
jgi:hypothetical protein